MPEVVQLVDNHSPDRNSLSNAKHIYALSMWSVENVRPGGWPSQSDLEPVLAASKLVVRPDCEYVDIA
jgi:hypothetical protein